MCSARTRSPSRRSSRSSTVRSPARSQAKAGIDCALHDLCARALGVPLYNLLGGKVRDSVPVLRIVAIKTPAEMADQCRKSCSTQGYRYFKIKVHGDVEDDVARVKAIRERVGEDAHLTIDANQSYSPKDAITAINRMARIPPRPGRAAGLARTTSRGWSSSRARCR